LFYHIRRKENHLKPSFLSISGIIILAAALATASGCKEDTIIKANIAPGNNNLGTTEVPDTLGIVTGNVYAERLKTSEKVTNIPVVHALGTMVDPFFGTTNAGIYFQVLPNTAGFRFVAEGVSYTLDSAVLILPYYGFSWGNKTDPKPQKFRVYRINEPMSNTADYYSDQHLQVRSTPLGEKIVDMKSLMTDTPKVGDNSTGSRHIRIPLSQDFVNDVKNNIGTGTFDNDANFLNYFNGFYIAPDSSYNIGNNTDLLTYIRMDGGADYGRAAIAFYYRENGTNETKTAFFNYTRDGATSKTANFNQVSRNYTGYPAGDILQRGTSDTLLLQNDPGLNIDLRIPGLDKLPVASILRAELVITKINGGTQADSLQTPNRIVPKGVDAAGNEYEIADFSANDYAAALAYVDGTKKTEKDPSGNEITVYRINIPREVQKAIIDKRNELHLRIKGGTGFPAAYRLIAGGRNQGAYRMQLNIVYSKPD